MIGAVAVAGPGAPERRTKHDHGQEEEDPCDLKHEFATHAAEGTQKTADAANDSPRNPSGDLTGCLALLGGLPVRGGTGGVLCGCGGALAGDAPGDPQADTEGAANCVSLHSVYDGSSDPGKAIFFGLLLLLCCSQPATEVR